MRGWFDLDLKEFLKEEDKRNEFHNTQEGFIWKGDLGEWAFQEIVDKGCWNAESVHIVLYEIAVGCLGKKEVDKRLKGLV